MKKIFIALALVGTLGLAGCNGTPQQQIVTKTLIKTVNIPDRLLVCNGVRVPKPDTMTNQQLATFIVKLVKVNRQCSENMKAIKQIITRSKRLLENRK